MIRSSSFIIRGRHGGGIGCLFEARRMSATEKNRTGKFEPDQEKQVDPRIDQLTEPTNCCMSGCANCVWIEYATELQKKLDASNEDVQNLILEKVQDPNMKAFLTMELRNRTNK